MSQNQKTWKSWMISLTTSKKLGLETRLRTYPDPKNPNCLFLCGAAIKGKAKGAILSKSAGKIKLKLAKCQKNVEEFKFPGQNGKINFSHTGAKSNFLTINSLEFYI